MWTIVAAGIVGVAIGIVAHILLSKYFPLYQSQVMFEVQPGVTSAHEVSTGTELDDEFVNQMAQTQIVLLMNRDIIESAVKSPEVMRTEWFQTKFIDDNGSPMILDAADALEDSLRAAVIRETQLFRLSWMAHNEDDVPVVLGAMTEAYMKYRESLDMEVFNKNYRTFQEQLDRTNLEIEELDQEIESYIREVGITSLDDPRYTQYSLAVQSKVQFISQAQTGLSVANTSYLQTAAKLEGTLEYTHDDIQLAEQDFNVASLLRETQELRVTLRALREKYPYDHQIVRDAEARSRAAEAELTTKRDEIIRRNLNAALKLAGNEVERAQRMLEELETELAEQDALLRELASKQATYESLNDRREYLEASRDADTQLLKEIQLLRYRTDSQRVRVAERAVTPREKAFPKIEIIVPLGFLSLVGLTVGIIFLRELTDQRVKTASDLAVLPGARILGVVPETVEDPTKIKVAEMAIRRHPNSVIAESYRQATTPLIKSFELAGFQTILFTGGLPSAGTSTTVTNIAAGIAATGRSVVVVDANFRRPRVAEIMGQDPDQTGLGDVLVEGTALDEVVRPGEYGVYTVTAGTPGSRIVDRLNTEQLDAVVAELRGRFDVVLFDTPPTVVAGETMVIANKVDAAVLVVRANQEQRGLVARLMNQFNDTSCQLLGLMLNRPRNTAGGYFKKNYATMAAYGGKSA